MSGGQVRLYCYPRRNRAYLAKSWRNKFAAMRRPVLKATHGICGIGRVGRGSTETFAGSWQRTASSTTHSLQQNVGFFWKVEDDGTIMRRASNNKQRLEGDRTGESLGLAGRRCLRTLRRAKHTLIPLGLSRYSVSLVPLQETSKRCALLSTQVEDIGIGRDC